MEKHGYKDLANIYDLIHQNRDYKRELNFLKKLFDKHDVKKVLDIGCGTGTHMKLLEKEGYRCTGIDINQEMLEIAEEKVEGDLIQADMKDFDLGTNYDAVISMYASFNHLTKLKEVKKALSRFKKHLNKPGIILLDLHNSKGEGEKSEDFGRIKRKMKWEYDPKNQIEKTKVIFNVDGEKIEDSHTMRIYSVEEISKILKGKGFSEVKVYGDYGFEHAEPSSKNFEVFGKIY